MVSSSRPTLFGLVSVTGRGVPADPKGTTMKTPKTPKAPSITVEPKTKLEALIGLIGRDSGADIAEMMAATGWQAHSVRGALASALKKKGVAVESIKTGGRRIYRSIPAKVG